jgi:hypothetical protein
MSLTITTYCRHCDEDVILEITSHTPAYAGRIGRDGPEPPEPADTGWRVEQACTCADWEGGEEDWIEEMVQEKAAEEWHDYQDGLRERAAEARWEAYRERGDN